MERTKSVKGLKDLRLQSHLLTMEAKDEWVSLEEKSEKLKNRLGHAWDAIEDVSEDVWDANKHVFHELQEGFQKLKRTLKD
ncbi:MAG: hypothetical protein R3A45_05330 [Bdellovibrionota bacterium]